MDFALKAIELALDRGVAVTINKDGTLQFGGVGDSVVNSIPQYKSDTVPNLEYGYVAKYVRKHFLKQGDCGIVRAHTDSTIRQAFNTQGWGCSLQTTDNPNEFFCTRIRITRRKRSY